MFHRVLFALFPILLASCAPKLQMIVDCNAIGSARPICGWKNPEDLVALPGERFILVSEYDSLDGERPGTLARLDLKDDSRRVLFTGVESGAAERNWGDIECPGPPGTAFSPHGIGLSTRQDGRLQLTVVQHGERESLELFEVIESTGEPELVWRGCILAEAGAILNDVAAASDGRLFVSQMMSRDDFGGPMVSFFAGSLFGADVGRVLEWTPDAGFTPVNGTGGPVPNGVQLSKDERQLFVLYSGQGEVRRVNLETHEVEASAKSDPLDNATWAPDGRLLVAASRASSMDGMACMDLTEGSCPLAHAIVAVDPDTLQMEDLYVGGAGTPGGAGTVGLMLADRTLLIGTFAGDRIVRVSLE